MAEAKEVKEVKTWRPAGSEGPSGSVTMGKPISAAQFGAAFFSNEREGVTNSCKMDSGCELDRFPFFTASFC